MTVSARIAIAGVAAAAVVALTPLPAGACSCVVRDLPAQVRAATAVFIGTVRDAGPVTTVFHVDRRYKGVLTGDTGLAAPVSGCGIPFTPGREYLVFAVASGNALTTDLCAGTTDDLAVAARLPAAGLPTNQRADTPEVPHAQRSSSRAVPIAVATALVAALGFATTLAARTLAAPRVVRRAL